MPRILLKEQISSHIPEILLKDVYKKTLKYKSSYLSLLNDLVKGEDAEVKVAVGSVVHLHRSQFLMCLSLQQGPHNKMQFKYGNLLY